MTILSSHAKFLVILALSHGTSMCTQASNLTGTVLVCDAQVVRVVAF